MFPLTLRRDMLQLTTLLHAEAPLSSYEIQHPVFFGAALKDEICLPMFGKAALQRLAKGPVTIREFDGDHWFAISHAEELNGELLAWSEGLNA